MHVQGLGHVVLKVRDLNRSEDFYSGALGMRIVMRLSDPRMAFFTLGTTANHHDFALVELGLDAPLPRDGTTGLAHVAFKVGTSAEEYRRARKEIRDAGAHMLYEADRSFAKSMHVLDPDGNEIELYVDVTNAGLEPNGKALVEQLPAAAARPVMRIGPSLQEQPPFESSTSNARDVETGRWEVTLETDAHPQDLGSAGEVTSVRPRSRAPST